MTEGLTLNICGLILMSLNLLSKIQYQNFVVTYLSERRRMCGIDRKREFDNGLEELCVLFANLVLLFIVIRMRY